MTCSVCGAAPSIRNPLVYHMRFFRIPLIAITVCRLIQASTVCFRDGFGVFA